MRTSGTKRTSTAGAYVERVNLAIDHIACHLANRTRPLRLADAAKAASLSPCHFHRVFQVLVGETPAEFVKRLRLERAMVLMAHAPRSKRLPLSTVASRSGFGSLSDFSRSFKQRYGVSPSGFDIGAWRASHRAELEAAVQVACGCGSRENAGQILHIDRLPPNRNPDGFSVRIRDLPARRVAYIRVLNPYKGGAVVKAIERLLAWATAKGFAGNQWLGYQWDNPEITSLKDCQYHAAVELPAAPASGRSLGVEASGDIGIFRFPPMIVAQVEVRGSITLELGALTWLYGTWLPRSGYVPDDQPAFEAWIGKPFAHGHEHFELHVQLPVRTR